MWDERELASLLMTVLVRSLALPKVRTALLAVRALAEIRRAFNLGTMRIYDGH